MTTKEPTALIVAHTNEWITGQLARHGIVEGTARQYRSVIADFCRTMGDTKQTADVTLTDVERWLAQPKRNGQPYEAQSLNARAAPIRAFFKWAAHPQRQLIAVNPIADMPRAKVPQRQPKSLTKEDVRRMLWVADGRDRAILMCGLHGGLRREEIQRMDLEHWNREDNTLLVIGKGNKEATVPVGEEWTMALTMHQAVNLDGRRTGPFWPSDRTSSRTSRLSVSAVGRIVASVAARAGVKATCHSLRHTCATDLSQAGVPSSIIQRWMRHESHATTGLYMTPRDADMKRYVDTRQYRLKTNEGRVSAARPGPSYSAEVLPLFPGDSEGGL